VDGLTRWARHTVTSAGYPGLAGLVLAENLFPPIPSEAILPLAGFLVSQGELTFAWAVLAATAGSVTGALLLYALARFGGRPLVLRLGRLLRVTPADLDRADAWFDRHGGWIVLGGRLVPGVRSLVSIPAGLSEMPVGRFVALTALGSTAWNALLIGAGWALGSRYEEIADVIGGVSTPLAVGVVVALAALFALWQVRARRGTRAV
jgi:membrane protein DedA with SNARE-associated domain